MTNEKLKLKGEFIWRAQPITSCLRIKQSGLGTPCCIIAADKWNFHTSPIRTRPGDTVISFSLTARSPRSARRLHYIHVFERSMEVSVLTANVECMVTSDNEMYHERRLKAERLVNIGKRYWRS